MYRERVEQYNLDLLLITGGSSSLFGLKTLLTSFITVSKMQLLFTINVRSKMRITSISKYMSEKHSNAYNKVYSLNVCLDHELSLMTDSYYYETLLRSSLLLMKKTETSILASL